MVAFTAMRSFQAGSPQAMLLQPNNTGIFESWLTFRRYAVIVVTDAQRSAKPFPNAAIKEEEGLCV
jgi:hypothetical protein